MTVVRCHRNHVVCRIAMHVFPFWLASVADLNAGIESQCNEIVGSISVVNELWLRC